MIDMTKVNLLTIFLVLVWVSISSVVAQKNEPEPVLVQIDHKLGKVVNHRVSDHETLYGLSGIYGVDLASIHLLNPEIDDNRQLLPPLVKIPITDSQILYQLPQQGHRHHYIELYYRVKKKDNLFRISRRYFDLPTSLLIERNSLQNQDLQEGQILHIGWIQWKKKPLAIAIGREYQGEVEQTHSDHPFEAQFKNHHMVSTNEVAFWNTGSKATGIYVLHRKAPPETIIEITNPMHQSIIYAKVIGRLPEKLYGKEIDMVVSPDLARALGVVDPKFFVYCRYQGAGLGVSR